jgi:hypothetical protein
VAVHRGRPRRPVYSRHGALTCVGTVTLELDGFATERLEAEAASQGVTLEDLMRHALMYYLADLDSGRTATRVMPEHAASPHERADKA